MLVQSERASRNGVASNKRTTPPGSYLHRAAATRNDPSLDHLVRFRRRGHAQKHRGRHHPRAGIKSANHDVKDAAAEGEIAMAISSQDADKFRLKHAEKLLALFEGARGRPARTTDELAQWLDSVDDDLADDIAREVAEEGRKAGREAAKKNGPRRLRRSELLGL
jgi:hypothetical protein